MNFYKHATAFIIIFTTTTIAVAQNQKNTSSTIESRDITIEAQRNISTENTTLAYNISLQEKLSSAAKGCQSTYIVEKEALNFEISFRRKLNSTIYDGAELAKANAEAPNDIFKKKQNKGFEYVSCTQKNKKEQAADLIKYVNSFKNQNTKNIAKQIFAQWLTVLDAVGESTFELEFSKLNSNFNSLTVELSI